VQEALDLIASFETKDSMHSKIMDSISVGKIARRLFTLKDSLNPSVKKTHHRYAELPTVILIEIIEQAILNTCYV
jgi:hypothetical protein